MISLSKRMLVTTAAATALFASSTAVAQTRQFNIPLEEAAKSIPEFARQAGLQITAPVSELHGIKTPAIVGAQDVRTALAKILAATNLEVASDDGTTVVLRRRPAAPGSVGTNDVQNAPPVSNTVTEVIVTAEKRAAPIQFVPVPTSTVNANLLANNNQFTLSDYYSSIPSLNVLVLSAGQTVVSIRGVTTQSGNPTVSVMLDGVSLGSSTALGNGNVAPDIDPSDIQRVEVLRGPQGTLYGASSIGGLLNYITVNPSSKAFSGYLQAGISGVSHAGEPGENVRGEVNIPITDSLAIRLNGFDRTEPGYIDNIETGQHGINRLEVGGGTFTALWQPSSVLSAKFTALVQDRKALGDSRVINPGSNALVSLTQNELEGTGGFVQDLQFYDLTLAADVAGINLVSSTSYSIDHYIDHLDITSEIGDLTSSLTNGAGPGSIELDDTTNYKFTQELRARGSFGTRVKWLIGGYYTNEYTPFDETILAATPEGVPVSSVFDANYPTRYEEAAAFGDLTFILNSHFDVQVGLRDSENRQSYREKDTGPLNADFGQTDPQFFPKDVTRANSVTYLVTPRFIISDDLMIYARFASGYRPGGPNPFNLVLGGPGDQFRPDTTNDYEVGVKGHLLHEKVYYELSTYYINWKDIQLPVTDPVTGFSYTTNGAGAKSEGVELSVNTNPWDGLDVSGWFAYDDAVLTQGFPSTANVAAIKGQRLPGSSKYSGNISASQQFQLSEDWTIFGGGRLAYVGDRGATLGPNFHNYDVPAYTTLNLYVGTRYKKWETRLFVNNVGDVLGRTYVNEIGKSYEANIITPRTVGLNVSRTF